MKRIFFAIILLMETSLAISGTRIMLIGNSITQGVGSSNGKGFRDDLYDHLNSISLPFTFVGSSGLSPYSGHFKGGARIRDMYYGTGGNGSFDVSTDMDDWNPNIVMIHLGTCDVDGASPIAPYTENGGSTFTTNVTGRLAYLLKYLLQWKNGEEGDQLKIIFVSRIIPQEGRENRVKNFNNEVSRIVQDSEKGQIPWIPPGSLKLVDHYSSFNFNTMMGEDGIHPNDNGYDHMADVYFNAFRFLPMYLVRISEENHIGDAGDILSDSLIVRVTDGYGDGIQGAEVVYEVTDGDAQIVSSSQIQTDSSGFGYVRVRVGNIGTSTITAFSEGFIDSVVSFRVTAKEALRIQGNVTYHFDDLPIPDVIIKWFENGEEVDTTDGSGYYNFKNPPYGAEVTLIAQKDRWSDVSGSTILSYDAALTARHSVGSHSLSSLECIAADVNRDGKVNMIDAAHIARYAVGFDLPQKVRIGEWKFSPDYFYYDPFVSAMTDQNFTGILLGDVHGGWTGPTVPKEKLREEKVVWLLPANIMDDFIEIPVWIGGKNVLSCDFICHFSPDVLKFLGADATEKTREFSLNYREKGDGAVRVGTFGTEPASEDGAYLTLKFKVLEQVQRTSIALRNVYVNDSFVDDVETSIETGRELTLPEEISLEQNYPNPFNESTMIRYQIPSKSRVRLSIYNSTGQEVVSLLNEEQYPGRHEVFWDGRDQFGAPVASGIYFYKLFVRENEKVGKMEMLR